MSAAVVTSSLPPPLEVQVAAQVIAFGGRARFSNVRHLARHHGRTKRDATAAVRALEEDRLVRTDGDYVVARDLAELAAYVADELDSDG